MKLQKTHRGFKIASFTDGNGEKCSIQKSSSANEPMIWLGVDDANPKVFIPGKSWQPLPPHPDFINNEVSYSTRMHLTREQVKKLIPHLQMFVFTGDI